MNEAPTYGAMLQGKHQEYITRLAGMQGQGGDPAEIAQVAGAAAGLAMARDLLAEYLAANACDVALVPTADLIEELARRHEAGMLFVGVIEEPDQPEGRYHMRYTGDWPAVAGLLKMLDWHLNRNFHRSVERVDDGQDDGQEGS